MPSDSKKKRDAKKKEAAKSRGQKKVSKQDGDPEPDVNEGEEAELNGEDFNGAPEEESSIAALVDEMAIAAKHRSCTGVLASHPDSRDLHIHNLSILFHGAELLMDSTLELNVGRRYGLIGLNGCGKSSLLAALAAGEVPVPDHIDTFLLRREMPPSEKSALACVMEVDNERHRLEKEAEELAHNPDPEAHERLLDVYERLDELDAGKAEAKAGYILHGLGFTRAMQHTKVKDFSGGWRMRIALARALFIRPCLMLLDEPTNHLDLNACVWLEEELKTYPRILVVISHSQDFLNGVCTNIIHMHQKKLKYYGGNYDSYIQTRYELEENQMKKYKWEQDQIAHMKNYIARFGHGSAKLARQAQSKEKTLKKMVDSGLTERVASDKTVSFYFPSCGVIPPPVIMVQHVSFQYSETQKHIYKDLDFGIDLDTRVATQSPIRRERQNSKRKRTEHTDNRIIGKKSDIISSLFRKNPEIPTITGAAVETVKENVFTGQTFKDLPIHPFLVSNLEQKQGFTYLTEVQKKAIPALLNKKDALIRSQTGSGKTLAYAIPIVQSLQARKLRIQRDDGPYALVIVPTRELALQSYETFLKLLKTFIWIVPGCLMGGEKRKAEKSRLRKGVNILVATPGRLIDHIKTTQVLRLARIQWLVIDEADRMLELGYEKDIAQILNALRAQCTDPPQTVLLSATLSQGVERLSSISLTEPEHIDMNQQVARHSSHHNPGADPGADQDFAVPSQLQQLFILTPCKLRLVTLAAFLLWKCRYSNPASKMIVFLSTQDSVQFHTKLFHQLLVRPKNTIDTSTTPELADGIQQNINFYQLYGDMPQRERQETFSKFSQAASGVLLCTDVAARGLDLPRVDWIVQYTPPGPVVDYVHRVGRTARAGTQGHSLLFLLPSEAAYIQELNKHKISLSQLQMSTVLQPLVANIKDLPQAGHVSAKHPSPRTQEEAATFLQDRFEELVLAHKTIHGLAGKGFQSFVKAYATLGRELKDIFKVNDLHLGHVAKSFALREAPTSVHSVAARSGADHKLAKRGKRPLTFRQATLSEYSDGLGNDKVMAKLGTKEPPKKKKKGCQH